MPFYRRRSFVRPMPARRRRKFFWVRDFVGNASPTAINNFDFLINFRNDYGGATLNFPDIVIWRVRLRISITFKFTGTAVGSGDGFFVSTWVDSRLQTVSTPIVSPYEQQYMLWTFEPATKFIQEGGYDIVINSTDQRVAYMEYDIKTRRKFKTLDDSLLGSIAAEGNITLTNYNYWVLALLKVP